MEECEKAFDAGLLLAALNLVVTIPDVCANIDGTDYRKWCKEYLIELWTMEDNLLDNARLRKKLSESYGEIRYPRYVNYDAIEVPFVNAIPSDYRKTMSVPTTFLDKYNPDQFEIIGTRLELAKPIREVAKTGDRFQSGGRSFYIRTGAHELTRVYDRIVIRAKHHHPQR